jgi:Fuc2NAc and GlcNAc transferase
VREVALKHGIIDEPNARSAHSTPIPRGGGLAIVFATSTMVAVAAAAGIVDRQLVLALLGGGIPIAWVGFRDDRASVPVRMRLAVHAGSAIWAMYVLGGLPPIQAGERIFDLGVVGDVLGVLALAWTLNLFNFMDGIDGIAASEATFIAAAGGVLCLVGGASASVPAAAMILAAASAGFLIWNWPPAKIFMGDVGSGYLGFIIAVLAIASGREAPAAPFIWLILGAVFFADSLVTLLRRLARGERVYEAHSSHAYQVLARKWGRHLPVTATAIGVNLLVLLPLAWLANTNVTRAASIAAGVQVSLGIAVLLLGRYRRTNRPS